MGNDEWGMGNGGWGMGNGECKMCPTPSLKNRRGMGNREWGMRMEYYRVGM